MDSEIIVVIVVVTALIFDFTNGFHDTANVVATSISTRAMAPRIAVGYAAILNFAGAFISLQVAATVAQDVVNSSSMGSWPSSAGWSGRSPGTSSRGTSGSRRAPRTRYRRDRGRGAGGRGAERGLLRGRHPGEGDRFRRWSRRSSPSWSAAWRSSACTGSSEAVSGPVTSGFRFGQVISGGLLALAHGTNDAQKTMGVIRRALVANGSISAERLSRAHLGGGVGGHGNRARHLRGRLADHQDDGQPHPQDGHRSGVRGTGAGASVILAGIGGGLPALHDTHDLRRRNRLGRRQAAVGCAPGMAGDIVVAWVLTLPAAAAIGALTYVSHARRSARAPPVPWWSRPVILAGAAYLFVRRAQGR